MTFSTIPRLSRPGNWNQVFHDLDKPWSVLTKRGQKRLPTKSVTSGLKLLLLTTAEAWPTWVRASKCSIFLSCNSGFIKRRVPSKMTGCEQDLAMNLPRCFCLIFLVSFIRKTKNAQLKNPTDLLHKNVMEPLMQSKFFWFYQCRNLSLKLPLLGCGIAQHFCDLGQSLFFFNYTDLLTGT